MPAIPPWTLALATALLFAGLDIAAVLTAGVERAPLHNPIGLAALAWVVGPLEWLKAPGEARQLPVFQAYALAKTVVAALAVACAAVACATRPARRRTSLLAVQMACALALDSIPFHLLVAVQLAMLLPLRQALAWLAIQYLLGAGVDLLLVLDLSQRLAQPPRWPLLGYLCAERVVVVGGFALVGRLVLYERRTRQALAAAHAQVLATQSLLADTVRGAERMRIARDLHDMVGHHLTALNLHLDLALRQAGSTAPPALPTARDVSHDLLAQVRSVVTSTREDRAIDLAQALRMLCAGLPGLKVDLRIDAEAARHPAPAAHALFCCIQEAVTNTLRHAQAGCLTIVLEAREGMTVARVADDGRGKPCATEGNGLRGMRERLADLGGALSYRHGGGDGFALEMRLPHAWGGA
ncbi:sensor histidine kinase [Massilia sp. DD77]|uniref:sensor histidine kinase n=1 Tax=Massilia sp. DD77 TaxID=3109349 RepID=UPI003000ECFD